MITKMTGTLTRVLDDEARLQVGPFEYQVLIPEFVRRQVQTRTGAEVTFHTLEYIEGGANASKMIPRRVGFLSETELDFFELFCTVDKIGSKKALKAMGRPIKEMADAIQRQDAKWLTTMPGIGKQTAEQIIATLKNKVTKFAMAAPAREPGDMAGPAPDLDGSVFEDAYAALLTLGLNPVDARNRLDQAAAAGKPFKTVEDVLNVIFRKE
jgi:Holliday junction DNA helicase RuvA